MAILIIVLYCYLSAIYDSLLMLLDCNYVCLKTVLLRRAQILAKNVGNRARNLAMLASKM